MIKDQLHIDIDDNECERTNNIVNGYFYIIYYDITNGNNKRIILNPKDLYNLYSNIAIGVRCYNRKGVWDAYRIKNQYIPKYLEVSSEFVMTNSDKVNTDFNLAPGNKGF